MDFYTIVTVLLVILITCVMANYSKILLEKSKLPPGPTPLPIIGTLHLMNFGDIVKSLMELSKKYGDIFTIYEGTQPVIVLCSYKALKETFIDKAEEFSGRAYYASFHDFTKGEELAFSNGEKWKEMRRFALLTLGSFGVGKRSFEERIREEAGYLTEVLRKANGSPINPNYPILRSVSNVVCSLVFGSRFEYKDENFQKVVKCIQEIFRIMSTRWGVLYNVYPNVMKYIPGPHHTMMGNFGVMADFIKEKMENNMKTLDSNNPRDFIDCFLIKMEKEEKNEETFFNINTLVMNSLILFFAGTESISATLRFAFLHLMKYPNIAEKVYNEIDNVIGQRPPSYEDRFNMPYTEAFIYEVQRVGDVVPLALPHELIVDTDIRNYTFKKGTVFTPVLTGAHNDITQFDNPENFDPKNFLDGSGKLMKRESLMPFSIGKRICPGKSLANMEIFIFITTLLQNFTIKSPVAPEKISVAAVGSGLGHIPPSFEICLMPRTQSQE
ncbi:cytochrome P450 2F2-like isoform 1-T2 [Anomaloglossus baeobatrachus]|uniref:cytochrome P450 2F2-like n=1 Tax=Anomaloglossus baeobatrachus TaxID=238106 RepID=UPI003F4F8F80